MMRRTPLHKTPARIAEEKLEAAMALEAAARLRLGVTGAEWRVLRPLLLREAVSYESLAVLAYGDHPPAEAERAVQAHMHGVRKKLGVDAKGLITLRQFGYALEAGVRRQLLDRLGPVELGPAPLV